MSRARRTSPAEFETVLQPQGEVTLPAWVRDALGLEEGDRLAISVSDQGVLLTPRRAAALGALREIQAAFAASGLTENELQDEGLRVREELGSVRRGAA
jgi:AbrB family looped-hinge helix DNA binding protein